jgi:sulfur carrier protein ThiS
MGDLDISYRIINQIAVASNRPVVASNNWEKKRLISGKKLAILSTNSIGCIENI